jgi:hypothetical protein
MHHEPGGIWRHRTRSRWHPVADVSHQYSDQHPGGYQHAARHHGLDPHGSLLSLTARVRPYIAGVDAAGKGAFLPRRNHTDATRASSLSRDELCDVGVSCRKPRVEGCNPGLSMPGE